MADESKHVQEPDVEKHGPAVQSVTENDSHPADQSSEPGPYVVDGDPIPVNREGVSTNQAEPIAQSLVAGAGAPTPPEAIGALPLPEHQTASSEPLTAEQKKNAVFLDADEKSGQVSVRPAEQQQADTKSAAKADKS